MKLATDKAAQNLVINTQIADIHAVINRAFQTRPQRRHPNSNRWWVGAVSTRVIKKQTTGRGQLSLMRVIGE